MTASDLTTEEREAVLALLGNALDQAHDDPSQTYLWFITPDQDPDDEEASADAEALLLSAIKKLGGAR
jgi:hypothetical protein